MEKQWPVFCRPLSEGNVKRDATGNGYEPERFLRLIRVHWSLLATNNWQLIMLPLWSHAEAVLRPDARGLVSAGRGVLLIVVFGMMYGAMMGTFFGEGQPPRLIQASYSALKVPMLLVITFLLALPSFYVINALLGLAGDFPLVLRALLATQGGLTVVLASLGPFTVLFYLSTTNYNAAILFNAAMFAIASLTAQRLLKRSYAPLIARNARHKKLLRVWLIVYAFVGIQMGWVLRPFIGQPGSPTTFFRPGAWGNAYIEVWEIAANLGRGSKSWR